jgi:hypothetical protein
VHAAGADPSALHLTVQAARLRDGRQVVIRDATTADLAGIVDFFERLSTVSRYSRLLSPQARLRRDLIARIVAGGTDRLSVLAQPAGFTATTRNIVAVGGWVDVPSERHAEISVAVADAWQNDSLGTYALLVLLRSAFAAGHTRFATEVRDSHVRMLGLLRALGASTRSHDEAGVVCLEFELPAGIRRADAA